MDDGKIDELLTLVETSLTECRCVLFSNDPAGIESVVVVEVVVTAADVSAEVVEPAGNEVELNNSAA